MLRSDPNICTFTMRARHDIVASGIDIHVYFEVSTTHFYHLALKTVCCLAWAQHQVLDKCWVSPCGIKLRALCPHVRALAIVVAYYVVSCIWYTHYFNHYYIDFSIVNCCKLLSILCHFPGILSLQVYKGQ